jgi:hypothetical protein
VFILCIVIVIVFSFCVGCSLCVFLCTVFRLIAVLFCVMCVVCMLCLIVVPLPPGENPFAVKINIYDFMFVPSRLFGAGIETGYGLDDRGVGVRVPIPSRIFCSRRLYRL